MIINSATLAPKSVHKSRSSNSAGYLGLKYERAAITMLREILPAKMELKNNVWFYYSTIENSGACSPDALIFDNEFGFIIVVEIKYTYTPRAMEKLVDLYIPVVQRVYNKPAKPLVLVKNLVPGSPLPKFSISSALLSSVPLVQWLGTGSLRL